ncbi:MAG: radical SAM protein [Candidatus Omnitrophica bacterium]|nr:radical SAM protein [Candidatus Omnitrophota bacterium]
MKKTYALARCVMENLTDARRLAMCIVHITDQCNAGCAYCYTTRARRAREERAALLSTEEYRLIAQKIGRVTQLVIGGGEPFLRDDIAAIRKSFYQFAGVRIVSIATNGSLGRRALEVMNELVAACPRAVINLEISLDAAGAEHDRLRNFPGLFAVAGELAQAVCAGRRRLPSVNLVINTVITSQSDESLRRLREYLGQQLGADNFFHNIQFDHRRECIPPEEIGRYAQKKQLLCAGTRAVRSGIVARCIRQGYVDAIQRILIEQRRRQAPVYRCNAGTKLCVLTADGRLSPCEPFLFEGIFPDFQAVNLREHFYDVRAGFAAAAYRRALGFIRSRKCRQCYWSCAAITSLLYDPRNWPCLISALRPKKSKRTTHEVHGVVCK